MTTSRQINAIDATNGAAAIGDGARAVHVGAGGTYIEQQTVVIQERLRIEPNLFQVPFPHSDHFVGREEDLAQIHALLSGPNRRPVGLCGLGGIGKTQLAVEYAYGRRDEYPDGIFWLTAADPWTWQAGLAEIATRLGLAVPNPDKSDAQMRLAGELAAYLNGHPNALLIFDNVEEPADLNVSRVQGFVFAALGCRSLFTTRRRAADLPFAWLEVGYLPENASLTLLLRHESRRRALDPSHPDHPAARDLCRRLGYLPLTLELAGAFLARNLKVTIPAYLARIGKEGVLATVDRTHLRPEDLPTGHEPSIITTLAMQWEALADADARRALQTAALLGEAEQIPRARLALLTGLPDTAEEGYASPLEDALASLRDLSLVEELTADEVCLHPLVREFVAGRIADRDAFIETAVASLSEALWNVERLEAEARARGVDAVVADLRAAAALTPGPSPDDWERGGAAGVRPLLRALDLDSHILRRWKPEAEPAFLLQQWRNRCFEMGWDEPVRQAEALLRDRRLPYLRELRRLGTEDPALLRTLTGHIGGIGTVAVTPDGRKVVSGSMDNTLKVWDLASSACLRTLVGHTDGVYAVALTPDGRTAISGSMDRTLRVWDLASDTCLRILEGHTDRILTVALTPDGRTAISGSFDRTLKVWDLASGACLRTFSSRDVYNIRAVTLTPDGRTVISVSLDGTLAAWDLASGAHLRTLASHIRGIEAVALMPDGRTAISGLINDTLKVWNLETGACLRTLEGHTDRVSTVALTPDGRTAISGSLDRTLRVWDLETGACLGTLAGHTDCVYAVALTPDGRTAVSGADDGMLKVWDLESDTCHHNVTGHRNGVPTVALTPDGRTAVSGSLDGTLKVWNLASGACLHTLEDHIGEVIAVALTPDGRTMVSGSQPQSQVYTSRRSRDDTLKVWDPTFGTCLRTLTGHKASVAAVALTANGSIAVSVSRGDLRVWDLKTGTCLRTLVSDADSANTVALAPDGRTAVSGSDNGSLKIWDLASGACLHTLTDHVDSVFTVALAPDGRTAVSGARDGMLKVWDLESGTCLRTLEGHAGSVVTVALTPNGQTVISGSGDDTLRLWAVDSGECMVMLWGAGPFLSCAVAASTGTIVAGDLLGGVHFLEFVRWDQ